MYQFLAVRKTLEANMHMTHLFPPGRVFWAMHDVDLHPSHRATPNVSCGRDKLRLFEVLDVEKIFTQIIFAKDMLRYVLNFPSGVRGVLTILTRIARTGLINMTVSYTSLFNCSMPL